MAFENQQTEFEARRLRALAMGGVRKLAERRAPGVLDARERIDRLVDSGSFLETGLFATSLRPEMRERSPEL